MKILLVNHYAGSDSMGMEYRPFYFAREWIGDGHDVTILAADFSHLRTRQPSVDADFEPTEEEGVRFRWLRTNRYARSGMARVANMAGFAGKLFAYAGRIAREERPDLVICSSTHPLDIYGGARIAAKAGSQLVFEVHDLWPLTPMMLGGYSPNHPYIRLLQHAEDWAYRKADKVVSILPNASEYMVGRGLNVRKFLHVPNGVPASRAADRYAALSGPLADLIEEERQRGQFLVGYAGGITLSMAIETLIESARQLAKCGVSFIIVGGGPHSGPLRGQIARLRLDNIRIFAPIPKLAVPGFLSRMDVLAIPWRRSPLYRYGVSPNKVFDYMLAGRPIVQACAASNDLVAEADCGVTVAPEDPGLFTEAVLRLRALPEAERHRLGENGRRFVVQNHDCRVLARRLLDEGFGLHTQMCREPTIHEYHPKEEFS